MQTSQSHPAHTMPTDDCKEYGCSGVTDVIEAADVTEEILDMAEEYADGFYDGRIDWQDLVDRHLDGAYLDDGTRTNYGDDYDSPAIRKIQRETRKRLRG